MSPHPPLALHGSQRTITVDPAVVLAPMAGVTNVPFRALCRQFGGGLYVSEMVGARALVEVDRMGALELLQQGSELPHDTGQKLSDGRLRTMLRASFGPDEPVRSLQLYATDPEDLRIGVRLLADLDLVDHIDLNFGCPAPKVTRLGGGAALPWRTDLFTALVDAAVSNAGGRPVTVKTRKGIDHDHLTYLESGRIAADLGAAAITLHGRTAFDGYSGHADWDAIARLVDAVGDRIPVLGNGDIWSGPDAVRMIEATGCHGVVVGRGCLGRPWLFRDLQAALRGEEIPPPPDLGEIADLLARHGRLLSEHLGEVTGMLEIRKHTGWYLQGFPLGKELRLALRTVTTVAELEALLETVDRDMPMPQEAVDMQRGHQHGPKPVKLPEGWLDRQTDTAPLAAGAAAVVSGG